MSSHHPRDITSTAPDDSPFTLATRGCLVAGTEARGIQGIWLRSGHASGPICLDDSICSCFRISPGGIERTLHLPAGEVSERIITAPSGDAVVVQWSGAYEDTRVIGAGEGHADMWQRSHSATSQRRERELLRIACSEPGLEQAFEWAKYRLGTFITELPGAAPIASSYGLAGPGRFDRDIAAEVGTALDELGRRQPPPRTAIPHTDFDARGWINGYERGEKGAWAGPDASNDAAATAAFITAVTQDLLGFAPDAERGRLTLRPWLPAGWTRFNAENIRVGDALVALEYENSGDACRFTITQTAGAMPVRLILEPALADRRWQPVVDATVADLDVKPVGDRIILPVQIMLDERRVVEFHAQ